MAKRRRVSTILSALLILTGGASLAACTSATDSNLGTSANDPANRAGNDPAGTRQGHLPDLSNSTPGDDGRSAGQPAAGG